MFKGNTFYGPVFQKVDYALYPTKNYITLQQIGVKKRFCTVNHIEILSSGNYCLAFKQPEPDD